MRRRRRTRVCSRGRTCGRRAPPCHGRTWRCALPTPRATLQGDTAGAERLDRGNPPETVPSILNRQEFAKYQNNLVRQLLELEALRQLGVHFGTRTLREGRPGERGAQNGDCWSSAEV